MERLSLCVSTAIRLVLPCRALSAHMMEPIRFDALRTGSLLAVWAPRGSFAWWYQLLGLAIMGAILLLWYRRTR
jgi:hypothetical protein